MPERRYFRKDTKEGVRTHQIHVVQKDSEFWNRHPMFCDYLRTHPEVAKNYDILKRALAPQNTDTNEFAQAKTDFIKSVLDRAKSAIKTQYWRKTHE